MSQYITKITSISILTEYFNLSQHVRGIDRRTFYNCIQLINYLSKKCKNVLNVLNINCCCRVIYSLQKKNELKPIIVFISLLFSKTKKKK